MKRRIAVLLIGLLIFTSLPISAMANSSRVLAIVPGLSFVGTRARCSLSVTGNNLTDEIEAVIKLWNGSTCLYTWNASGTGYLGFSDTLGVVRNREYKLTVDVVINGVAKPRVSISKKCE